MNASIKIGTVARVAINSHPTRPQLAVIKASPEMGFLVWLNYESTGSRRVIVSKSLGDVEISQTFWTVGHLRRNVYHSLSLDYPEREVPKSRHPDETARVQREHARACRKLENREIARLIHDACQRLGVTKLWKHFGVDGNIGENPDFVVMELTEEGDIHVEAEC